MCTKPRNMRTASRKITRGFDDYSEQAVFQPALHSRITYAKPKLRELHHEKRPHLRASLFTSEFGFTNSELLINTTPKSEF